MRRSAVHPGHAHPVKDVLHLLAAGVEEAEFLEDYPYLETEDMRAFSEYAAAEADHPVLVVR